MSQDCWFSEMWTKVLYFLSRSIGSEFTQSLEVPRCGRVPSVDWTCPLHTRQ